MPDARTHLEIVAPELSIRALADYMAASEAARRTIIRDSKFQPVARRVQHDGARLIISRYLTGEAELDYLTEQAESLRGWSAESELDRDLFDYTAEYLDRFAEISDRLAIPDAEHMPSVEVPSIELGGLRVTVETQVRLRRLTRTNKLRIGGAMLRYAKGKALKEAVGLWQSAFLFGYLSRAESDEGTSPEQQLCLTLDAFSGASIPAPTDSVRRFQNMEAACATIAERWENIPPPPNAVL